LWRAPGWEDRVHPDPERTDTGQGSLVFFLYDLLHLNGENLMTLPVVERKSRLESLLNGAPASLRYNDYQIGQGPRAASYGQSVLLGQDRIAISRNTTGLDFLVISSSRPIS
jgi:ATP-dependent DNA ligase